MTKTPRWLRITGLIAALALFGGIGTWADWSKAEWAAWVQAVGSIAAILAASRIARWQAAYSECLAREERRLSASVRVKVVQGLLSETESCGHVFRWAQRENFNVAHFTEKVRGSLNVIRRLPAFDLPSPEAVDILIRAEGILAEYLDFSEKYSSLGDEKFERSRTFRTQAMARTAELQKRCDAELNKYLEPAQ